jgi:hypothetical protein
MEPKIGETFVFGDVDPVKFPNKPIWTVKEVSDTLVVLSCPNNKDWPAVRYCFYSYFTKV